MTPTEFDCAATELTGALRTGPERHSGGRPERHTDEPLGRLLDCLRGGRGFDFTDYQRPSLARRVEVRMSQVGIRDLGRYAEYVRQNPAEAPALCQTVWINATGFFRDPAVWEQLRDGVLPELLARRPGGAPVRIWSAGCASGQEVYSLAMLLAEALGPDGLRGRVEIYATDVDDEALVQARRGLYPDRAVAAIPADMRRRYVDRYLERTPGGWRVGDALRRVVRFRRQDLLRSRPAGAFDLILCRNTLIYFSPDAQRRVLARLRRGLTEDGYLLLGRSECPVFYDRERPRAECFAPVDLGTRLYARSPRPAPRSPRPAL